VRGHLRGAVPDLVAVLIRHRQFGVHLFSATGKPRAPFPDKTDGKRPGAQVALTPDGTVLVVPPQGGYMEVYNLDGGQVRTTKIPAVDASGLAVAPDGTAYVLDARRRAIVGVPPKGGPFKAQLPRTVRSAADISCDGFGRLYLLDGRSRSVSVWRSAPRAPAGPRR
jgi:hypothetical protein